MFVDLVDRHIEADIVGSGVLHMFHDGVVCVAPDGIVACPVTVEAEQDQIRLRQINGEGAVGHDVDQEKAHFLGLHHQVPHRARPVMPQEGLSPAEEQDAHPHMVEELHLPADLFIGMVHRCQIVDRAVPALQIAPVCDDHCAQDGLFFPQKNGPDPKGGKMQK